MILFSGVDYPSEHSSDEAQIVVPFGCGNFLCLPDLHIEFGLPLLVVSGLVLALAVHKEANELLKIILEPRRCFNGQLELLQEVLQTVLAFVAVEDAAQCLELFVKESVLRG